MTSLKDLLPGVLAEVARSTGRARQLKPVWDDVVGPAIARSATPLALEGTTLVVGVSSMHWASELGRREDELRERLAKKLGRGTVSRLRFRLSG